MSENLQSRVQVLRKLHYENGKSKPKVTPTWYDPQLFRRAQQLFHGHAIVILVSQFYGLITGLNLRDSQVPLLATGNSQTISKLYARYISTVVHVRNWFSHDPFDPATKSYKSLKLVRGFHRQVASELNRVDETTKKTISNG